MQAAIETSHEITVSRDWPRSLALILLCIFTFAAFAYFMQSDATSSHDRRAKTASYIIVPIMAVFTPWAIFRTLVPFGPLLRIGPNGFSDRRINAELVPWSEVKNIVSRSEFVTLTLSRRFAKTYSMSLGQKILKRRRKAGPSHLVVADWCMQRTTPPLQDLLATYWKAHGAAPQAVSSGGA